MAQGDRSFAIIDLADIREQLGSHFDRHKQDEYTGVCPVCSEDVPQDVDECPICGVRIVWRNSRVWKQLYGPPEAAIRRLSIVEPEDEASAELCRLAGVPGFANRSEAKRWARAARKLGQRRMLSIARSAAEKRHRGRAVIAYALNLADKIAREEPRPKTAPRPRPSASEHEIMV